MKTITQFFAILAISLASVSAFAQPTTTLTPTVTAANAKFTYNSSGAYTNAALMTMSADDAWGGLFIATSYPISGKNVICLTPANTAGGAGVYYHGATLASTIDVSGMKYLHVDVWVPAALEFTNLGVSPISTGGNQYLYNLESASGFTKGGWNSIDIPLTTFTAGTVPSPVNLSSVFQFIVKSDQAAGITSIPNNTVYIDNIYYWTDVTATLDVSTSSVAIAQPANSTGNFNVTATQNWNVASDQSWLTVAPTSGTSAGATLTLTATANNSSAIRTATVTVTGTDATTKTVTVTQAGLPIPASPTPTVAAANVKSIYCDAFTASVTNFVYLNQQWWNSTWSSVTLADSGNALKLVSTTSGGGGGGGGIQFDALTITGMTNLHFDIFPGTDATTATMKYCVSPTGTWFVLPTPTNLSTLTANTWNSFDIPVSSLSSGASTLPVQVGFGTFTGPGTFYIDNVLFYNGTYTFSTGISSVIADNGIKCYPSMAKNSLNVSANSEISEIGIINLVGQFIKTVTINSISKSISLNDLVSGQYLVRIKLANGQIATQKFVKL